MPDDNSCLFRAFAQAVLPTGDDKNMPELRQLITEHIHDEPEKYTKVVLEQEPAKYCEWIKTNDAWGGAIELGILSEHFEIEICSIDVQVLLPLALHYLQLKHPVSPSGQVQRRQANSLYTSLLRHPLRHHRSEPV
jgi:hypothetical protein